MPIIRSLTVALLPPVIFIAAGLFLFACANVVSPAGGPRDETPPVVLRSTPPNFSPNFVGGEIRIYFDEFVELKEINQKLLISPPLEKQPEVKLRGRSVIIELEEELRRNTTYNFFFGDAIVDITEGNAIPNFQFVVSTGPFVDSLSIAGRVTEAFSLKPAEGVYVMLYDEVYDSIPYLERPVYLAKTDKEGRYSISNMREGEYKIFALQDVNSNFKYDLPNERIAFLDSLITPEYVEPPVVVEDPEHDHDHEHGHEHGAPEVVPGTIPEGEAPVMPGLIEDFTTDTDSIAGFEPFPGTVQYHLRLFLEADTVQRIMSSSLVRGGLMQMVFRVPFDSVEVHDLSESLPANWFIPEPSNNRDTLLLWLLPPAADTLHLQVWDRGLVLDTLKLSTRPREARGRGAAAAETIETVGLRLNASRGNKLPFFEPLTITTTNPLQAFDTSAISMMTADSAAVEVTFDFADALQRRVKLLSPLEQNESYLIEILPGAFTDIFGLTNDTLKATFSTTQFEDYGFIILTLDVNQPPAIDEQPEIPGQFILQLLDKDGKLLREKFISGSGIYEFTNLLPGNYGLRLIHDLNKNGQWDTGHYLRKIQPEPVYLYDGMLQIRQNWESEMNWNVNL